MNVYVCYNENNHELAWEFGAVGDIQIFGSSEKAIDWFISQVIEGVGQNCFLPDEENEITLSIKQDGENTSVNREIIDRIFSKNGKLYITMFRDRQENWDVSYDIVVQTHEVK